MSIAPQNEAPIQSPATIATIPISVELSWIRVSASCSVSCSVSGKSFCRSVSTVASMSALCRILPKTNRTSSANGKTESIRL